MNIDKLSEIHAATHPARLRTVKGRDGEERMALLAALNWEREDEDDGEAQAPWSAPDGKMAPDHEDH